MVNVMRNQNTKTSNKNASKKEENRIKTGYYRVIPSHIADDPNLKASHRDTFSLISAVLGKEGYCNYENWEFAEALHVSLRSFKRYLAHLQKQGLIIIEIRNVYYRKIWTSETWAQRERLSKIYSPGQKWPTPGQKWPDFDNSNKISLKKDNTEKIPLPKPPPKKAAKPTTAPSSPIIPLFSYSWKNKTTGDFEKIENGITQKEMEKLLEIGLKETEIRQICNEMAAWAEKSNGTIRFKNANVYKKILDWKRKKDLKKEEKKQLNKEKEARKEMDYSEREQKNIPDVEGKRQDDFKAYITKVRENPKNSLICNLIRPNGGCTNAELFRINGRTLHSTLNYNEVNYKDKMAAWMKDMTQEFKERDKLKNSW